VTDAIKTLLRSGMIDPRRVAIMGTDFGAYLALSGAVFEPDLYRCAVVDVGVFDWEHVMKEERYFQFDSAFYATMIRRLGDPKKQKEKFEAITPLRHIDQVKIPVFVDYAKNDRLYLSESRRLISELERNRVPHEVLQVGSEFRGRDYLDNKVELYTRIEAFLAKNLAP
jgi:dipeptidyl aminopeptidase/acylaminoacyl peptidase